MTIAIEGLIPDRRAVSAQSKPAPERKPPFYGSERLRNQNERIRGPPTATAPRKKPPQSRNPLLAGPMTRLLPGPTPNRTVSPDRSET